MLLAHDSVVPDEFVVVLLGHDTHLDEDLWLEEVVDVEFVELLRGVFEEHGHALVDARVRDVVDDVQRLVQAHGVQVDVADDFEGVGLDSRTCGQVGVGGGEQT